MHALLSFCLGNWVDSEVEDSYFVLLVDPLLFFMHVFLSSFLGNWVDIEVEKFCFASLVDPFLHGCFLFLTEKKIVVRAKLVSF